MASNIAQVSSPYVWCSANDDLLYRFSFNQNYIDSVTNDTGNAQVNLLLNFDITPLPGEYIYILSNVYVGTFKILTVTSSSSITIDTPYISSIPSGFYSCYHLRVPTFSLYKGFDISESYPDDLPYTKIADLKPPVLYDDLGLPYIEINIRGYTRRMFTIRANTVANSIDFSMFNAVRLTWDGLTTYSGLSVFNFVLNSTITNEELLLAVSYGEPLYPVSLPVIPSSGVAFYSIIDILTSGVPRVIKYVNGIKQ